MIVDTSALVAILSEEAKGWPSFWLNFSDCFFSALARSRNEELLFKGNDFGKTGVWVAL